MRDHGAHAIVPLNIIMMVGCVAASLATMPWWITALVMLLMVALRNVARDPYGGMQLCVLLLPGLLLAILGSAQRLGKARDEGLTPELGSIMGMALVALVGFALSLLATMAIVVAVLLVWEWLIERLRLWRSRKD